MGARNTKPPGGGLAVGHSMAEMGGTPEQAGGSFRNRAASRRWEFIRSTFQLKTKNKNNEQRLAVPSSPSTTVLATNSTKPPPKPVDLSPKPTSEMSKTYKIDWSKEGELGSGHFATVYRGERIDTGEQVALKRVSLALTRIEAMETEVKALRAVTGHQNIMELYGVYVDKEYMMLVLELLAGGELFSRIVASGAYTERDASRHMKKIGSALLYMHERGIVHRDLKPENLVLVSNHPNSDIKITDFGLSKILKDDEETIMTVCGTKAYAAPEVGFGRSKANRGIGYTSKVDTWSLGVILYVIVAAYHPFDPYGNDNDDVIWGRICDGDWSFDDPVWNTLSAQLRDVLEKLIEINPEKRLSSLDFMNHPWITSIENARVEPLIGSLIRQRSSKYWKNIPTPLAPITPVVPSTPVDVPPALQQQEVTEQVPLPTAPAPLPITTPKSEDYNVA